MRSLREERSLLCAKLPRCSATRENPHVTLRSDGQRNGNEGHARASESLIRVIVATSSASLIKSFLRRSNGIRAHRPVPDRLERSTSLGTTQNSHGVGPRRASDILGDRETPSVFLKGCLSTYLGLSPEKDRPRPARFRADRLVGLANKSHRGMCTATPMHGQCQYIFHHTMRLQCVDRSIRLVCRPNKHTHMPMPFECMRIQMYCSSCTT